MNAPARLPASGGCRPKGLVAAAVALSLLAGCAGVPQFEQPGAARADVLARLGPPTAVYALPDGERLQYSQQPMGTQVHNLDFDAAGRLRSVDQVLDAAHIDRIVVGEWTVREVERTFGRPARVERVARFDGDIWTYLFRDFSGLRRLHVHLDRSGVVRQVLTTDVLLRDPPGAH